MPKNIKKERRVKDSKKSFIGRTKARFQFNFPNGNWLSTIWGSGTYTENYDKVDFLDEDKYGSVISSNDVEIMFTCGEKLKKKILKKYNDGSDDPIGHLGFKEWLEIVNLLSRE